MLLAAQPKAGHLSIQFLSRGASFQNRMETQ